MTRTFAALSLVLLLAACADNTPHPLPIPTTTTTPILGLSTSSGATATTTTTAAAPAVEEIRITVAGSQVTGGGRHKLRRGQSVRIVVTADVSDEVHLHGYDKKANVTPTAPATIELVVNVPGVFEIELESKGRQLAELEVTG